MIGIVGINYKSAPINIREQFVIDKESQESFLISLAENTNIKKAAVLSTCNRSEIYFTKFKHCNESDFNSILTHFCAYKNIKADLKSHFYSYSGENAVKHIFNVASGLDSMILGENQILSQIREAYRISVSCNFTDTVLNRVFHKAFEAGKRVRTETSINAGASSISFAAVELAIRLFKDLATRSVLLIGAGETGELALQSLTKRGCRNIFITNRTFSRAEKLVKKYNAEPVQFKDLYEHLIKCDIIIGSSSSKTSIIQYSRMQEIIEKRHNRPIFFIDLSVPRIVEEEIKKIKNVYLYNIDDLEKIVADNFGKRQGEIVKANAIVNDVANDFISWYKTLNLKPTIELLTEKYKSILSSELKSIKNKMDHNEYKKVSEFEDIIKGKYLGLIIKNLKTLTNNGEKLEYINLVNNLFSLRGDNSNK